MTVLPLLLGDGWYGDRPGGLNRYFADLLGALQRLGINSRGTLLGPALGAPVGVTCRGREHQPLLLRLWHYRRAAGRAALGATVVDAHFALYAFWPVLVGQLRRLPLVVHFQGPWAAESLFEHQAPAGIRTKHLIELLVYRRADHVIVLSGAFKRLLVERYGVAPWQIHVVPPGVDLKAFCPGDRSAARARLGVAQDARLVVAVRRLVPRMGLDVLLEAWALVKDAHPGGVLAIAGEGPQRATLEGLAARLDVTSSVRFLGRVDDAALVSAYQAADVSVVPSVALEGFGLIVLETLACGTPVIATDVGGLPEVLVPLDPTLVVHAGDPKMLADRLSEALSVTPVMPDADRCRHYAESFTWARAAVRHQAIYAEAIRPSRDKPRVVYLDHCAQLSGGELAMLRLLPALGNVDAHVILAEDGPLVAKLLQAGISAEVLPMAEAARDLTRDLVRLGRLPGWSAVHTAGYVLRLAYRLCRLRPDLVHTNSLKAALYGGVAGRLAGVPVVWHVRDRIADDYLPAFAVRLVRSAGRWLPAAVIANSEATRDTLAPTKKPVAIVASPVGAEFCPRRQVSPTLAHDALRVGIVGRVAPWKGQHLFLGAFARAFAGGTERAVVIGAPLFGEVDYERGLHELARERGLAGRVEFRGFREDVAGELDRLDIMVHASLIPEPYGLVVAEAMAMGVPVVAADAGGPAEMIADGVSGLLYPMGDSPALARALTRLADNPGLRRQLAEAARHRARQFTPTATATKVMAAYRELLGDRWPMQVPIAPTSA